MQLREYLIRRLIQTFITVIVVLIMLFIIFNLLGNPLQLLSFGIKHPSQAQLENESKAYGIPMNPWAPNVLPGYLAHYMFNMLTLNWGRSITIQTGTPVVTLIAQRAPWTILLVGTSTVLAYILGILVGIVVMWKRGTVTEFGTIVGSLFFYSMPSFLLGFTLLYIFAFQHPWFPLNGYYSTTYNGNSISSINQLVSYMGTGGAIMNILWHFTLPIISLTILSLAGNILLMRQAMLEAFGEDYMLTAKAKGLTEWQAMKKHAAPNAMLPIVTSITLSIGGILGGAIITEDIFTIQGMGLLFLEAIVSKDLFVLEGTFFMLALLTIFANIIADIMYAWLDPRVKL